MSRTVGICTQERALETMTRRQLGLTTLGLGAAALSHARHALAAAPHVDAARLMARLEALRQYGGTPAGGTHRVAYGDADVASRALVTTWMCEAGLTPGTDHAGNLLGRRAGTAEDLRPVVFGSHTDSVPDGGNYDGPVGVIAAIEVAHVLRDAQALRHPIEVVVWANEEGGLFGSRAVSGQLAPAELAAKTHSGRTVGEGIRALGGAPDRIAEVRRAGGSIAAYLELHIEQGGVLEATRTDIGVVEGIVGIHQWDVTITGFANHAGTTPMDRRQDAMLAAGRFIDAVHRIVTARRGRQVGTVGRLAALPGAPNVIPGTVTCSLELRDLDAPVIAHMFERIEAESRRIADATGTTFAFTDLHVNEPAPSDPRVRAVIDTAARGLGLSTRAMPSGAGHDAQAMARLGPMGMIFIPSIGGISHSPKEFSRPEDIARGAAVLLECVRAIDAWA